MANLIDVVHLEHKEQTNCGLEIDHVGQIVNKTGKVNLSDIRIYNILHYVICGKGFLSCGGQKTYLQAGDVFLFPKNREVSYGADSQDPWSLYYVGYYGSQDDYVTELMGLTKDTLCMRNVSSPRVESFFRSMLEAAHDSNTASVSLTGWLYLIIGELLRHSGNKATTIEPLNVFHKISSYIRDNLSSPQKMAAIASLFHISESHMYRMFMRECGLSPQQYYEKARINRACTMIVQSNLSYKEIAEQCGYEYESHFYKSFKKIMHMTPAEYRKNR